MDWVFVYNIHRQASSCISIVFVSHLVGLFFKDLVFLSSLCSLSFRFNLYTGVDFINK